MRGLIALVAAIVLAGTGFKQDTKPFTFKTGSVMAYEDSQTDPQGNVTKNDVTYTVTKVEGDKTFVDANDGTNTAKLVFSYSKEFFLWGTVGEDGSEHNMNVFKLGAKKGDTWKPNADAPDSVKVTYEDDEEVTTPAGKFNCKRLVVTAGGGVVRVSFWFADKVGMVKGQKEMFGNVSATIELKKFAEGK